MGHEPLSVSEWVVATVRAMTLDEKVAQLSCITRAPEAAWLLDSDNRLDVEALLERHPDGIGQLGRPSQRLAPAAAVRLTNDVQDALAMRTRLGIGALFNEEGIHGHMAVGATSFPSAIGLASTWDIDLVESVYGVVAREVRARGSNYVYAPVLDLARDPRWGRVEETFGEDPYLVARLGVATVRGLQGTSWKIPHDKVLACAKHFVGHGVPEAGMNAGPLHAGERELREEYLPPFEAVVRETGVGAVMAAYHEIDGVPCHTNRWLLTDVLRGELGFEGMITSDGFGVPQLVSVHRTAADEGSAARLAIEAGVDCEVPEPRCFATLVAQVNDGSIPVSAIDGAVTRVLAAKERLGLVAGVAQADAVRAETTVSHPDHQALALEVARRSAVLLVNDGPLLPLDTETVGSIAVIGPHAAEVHLGGYSEDAGTSISILDGIRRRVEPATVTYTEGCRVTDGPQGASAWWSDDVVLASPAEQDGRIAEAVKVAERADVVVLVIGGNEGTAREAWSYDHPGDRDSLALPGPQQDLVEAVGRTGARVAAVVMGGRPLDLSPVLRWCSSILQVWYPGQQGGTAIAEILFGDVVPSGKVPITFPRSVGQIPSYARRRPSADRGYLFADCKPQFVFGHGLSYTEFAYGTPTFDRQVVGPDDGANVSVEVSNIGNRAGVEIVQCYINDRVASFTRPTRALCGFARMHLEPGATEQVSFRLDPRCFALVGTDMTRVVEPGDFDVFIGGSSRATAVATLTVR